MTTGLFWISYGAVWVLLAALSGGLLVLFRVAARAYRVQAPFEVGDVGARHGPALDASPPALELQDMAGDPVSVGHPTGGVQFVVFAKSTCPLCRVALDVLHSFAVEHPLLEAIVVCGGDRAAIEECASLVGFPMTAVADPQGEGANRWRVSRFPFGVLIDSAGVVRARGDPTSSAILALLSRHLERNGDGTGERVGDAEATGGVGIGAAADRHASVRRNHG